MEYKEVLQKVLELAREQFGRDGTVLGEESTAAHVPLWNSLSHLLLVTSVEKAFGVKFDLVQMIHVKSIGDLARATEEKLT